jgi:hypothetical protein
MIIKQNPQGYLKKVSNTERSWRYARIGLMTAFSLPRLNKFVFRRSIMIFPKDLVSLFLTEVYHLPSFFMNFDSERHL